MGATRVQSCLIHCVALALTGCTLAAGPQELELTTWSLAAIDPASGDVGVAVASCVPAHADAVAALVPGAGVAATQALWDLDNRNRVFEALTEGLSAGQVVARVTDPDADELLALRQYGVVTLIDGEIDIAGFTGEAAPTWSGIRRDLGMAVTVQGNTLVGEAVVAKALEAFLEDDPGGPNPLTDRLMRGLEAGSAAGGDVRCNRDGIDSTAATAAILVARGGDAPYATETITLTDQGTEAAPWLAISETGPVNGPNPLIELRRRYDEWRTAPSASRP